MICLYTQEAWAQFTEALRLEKAHALVYLKLLLADPELHGDEPAITWSVGWMRIPVIELYIEGFQIINLKSEDVSHVWQLHDCLCGIHLLVGNLGPLLFQTLHCFLQGFRT